MTRCPFCGDHNAATARECRSCRSALQISPAMNDPNLANEVADLARRGEKIEAIRLYREATGVSLAEAKAAVEAIEGGRPPTTSVNAPARESDAELEAEVVKLVGQRQAIAAIKLYRERTGRQLKDSKEAVEEIARRNGLVWPRLGCLGALLAVTTLLATTVICVAMWAWAR